PPLHFFQHLAHALRVGARRRRLAGRLLREEEVQVDRLLERADDVLGAGRDRVQPVLGEIEARAAQHEADDDRHADEQHREREQRTDAKSFADYVCIAGHGQSAFFMSSTIAFAASQAAATLTKYSRSRRSITPLRIEMKWVQKDSEATASTIGCGIHAGMKSSTMEKPDSMNRKQTSALRMNAITWLRVTAEMQAPIASMPPATNRLPM